LKETFEVARALRRGWNLDIAPEKELKLHMQPPIIFMAESFKKAKSVLVIVCVVV
jgi:hypothetical protein